MKKIIVFVLLLFIAMIPCLTLANGVLREIKVDISTSKVVVESIDKTTTYNDILKVEFDAGSTWINLEYLTEINSTAKTAKVKIELFDLIEYVDADNDKCYDTEEYVKKIGLGDLSPEVLTYQNISIANTTGIEIYTLLNAQIKYPTLSFELRLYLFGSFVEYNNINLEPTAMKLDLKINGFPYNKTDSSIALKSKVTIVATDASEEPDATLSGKFGKWDAFFNWGKPAVIDGKSTNVTATIVEESKVFSPTQMDYVSELYLCYEHGDAIDHDPVLGVGYLSNLYEPTQTDILGILMTTYLGIPLYMYIIAIVVIVIGVIYLRRR